MAKYAMNPNMVAAGLLMASGAGMHAYSTSEHNYAKNLGEESAHNITLTREQAQHQKKSDLIGGIGNIAIGLGIATLIFDPFERLREHKTEPSQ